MFTQSHTRDFDLFWAAYPLKVSKAAARKAWIKTANIRPPVEQVIARVRAYIAYREDLAKRREFVPAIAHASTWLNGERWEDQYEEAVVETPWHATASGIEAKGKELGVDRSRYASFPMFRSAVHEAVGLAEREGNVVAMAKRRA